MSDLDVLLQEHRKFEPSAEFRAAAQRSTRRDLRARRRRPRGASGPSRPTKLEWIEPWTAGARLEAAAREVVRRRQAQRRRSTASTATSARARRNKAALIWEGEPGDRRTLTYWDLYVEVQKFANVLKSLGVKQRRSRGDLHAADSRSRRSRCSPARASARSTRWCSAASRRSRCATASTTAQCKVLITADGGYRRGAIVPLKRNADKALEETPVDRARRRRAAPSGRRRATKRSPR